MLWLIITFSERGNFRDFTVTVFTPLLSQLGVLLLEKVRIHRMDRGRCLHCYIDSRSKKSESH